tara:strand:+ start:166 stop:618 length:453 start_codon:yes stop_codon:yes gene_type:complete
MLLESVIAANAAFAVIKKAVQNGKEISDCAKAIGAYLGHKEKVEEEVNKTSGTNDDLEAFYALEKLNNAEKQLEFLMKKTRLHMWQDFQAFKNKRSVQRANAAKAAIKAKAKKDSEWAETISQIQTALFIVVSLLGIGLLSLYMIFNFER